jgi:hypothetical protein
MLIKISDGFYVNTDEIAYFNSNETRNYIILRNISEIFYLDADRADDLKSLLDKLSNLLTP